MIILDMHTGEKYTLKEYFRFLRGKRTLLSEEAVIAKSLEPNNGDYYIVDDLETVHKIDLDKYKVYE